MARQVSTIGASRFLLIGLAMVTLATVASAQAPDPFALAEKFARIQATTDSLGFASTAADSAAEVAAVTPPMGGLRGRVDRSAWGSTEWGRAFVAGGPFMWWILAIAVVGFLLILERLWTLSRARVSTRRVLGIIMTTLRNDGVQAAGDECQKVRGPVAAVLYSGLQKADQGREAASRAMNTAGTIEMSFLERGLVWVSSVTTLAPLLGLLGSVYGMIHVLEGFAAAERITSAMVVSGIARSLVSTAFGFAVAIPASLAYNHLVRLIERLIADMEESSSQLLGELDKRRG
jgi:biopolymer transport protein ExbB